MGPLLKIVGLLAALVGFYLAVATLSGGSISGLVFALALLAIGAYALISGTTVESSEPGNWSGTGFGSHPSSSGPTGVAGLKSCPDCAESVRASARKCRYCGFWFAESTIVPGIEHAPGVDQAPAALPSWPDVPRGLAFSAFLARARRSPRQRR